MQDPYEYKAGDHPSSQLFETLKIDEHEYSSSELKYEGRNLIGALDKIGMLIFSTNKNQYLLLPNEEASYEHWAQWNEYKNNLNIFLKRMQSFGLIIQNYSMTPATYQPQHQVQPVILMDDFETLSTENSLVIFNFKALTYGYRGGTFVESAFVDIFEYFKETEFVLRLFKQIITEMAILSSLGIERFSKDIAIQQLFISLETFQKHLPSDLGLPSALTQIIYEYHRAPEYQARVIVWDPRESGQYSSSLLRLLLEKSPRFISNKDNCTDNIFTDEFIDKIIDNLTMYMGFVLSCHSYRTDSTKWYWSNFGSSLCASFNDILKNNKPVLKTHFVETVEKIRKESTPAPVSIHLPAKLTAVPSEVKCDPVVLAGLLTKSNDSFFPAQLLPCLKTESAKNDKDLIENARARALGIKTNRNASILQIKIAQYILECSQFVQKKSSWTTSALFVARKIAPGNHKNALDKEKLSIAYQALGPQYTTDQERAEFIKSSCLTARQKASSKDSVCTLEKIVDMFFKGPSSSSPSPD